MKPKYLLATSVFLFSAANMSAAHANYFTNHQDYQLFKHKLVSTGKITSWQIDSIMEQAVFKDNIISIMDRPGESKPWYQYRTSMVTDSKIARGKKFLSQNRKYLDKAEYQYGVPKSVVLGILGVETVYGANKGNFRALDALATLAFGYPRRAEYFQNELAEFILMTQEQGLSPTSVKSSYAGAMGYPQFMPSSFRKWAVDFDGDGRIDLNNSPADAIGSIANYLYQHGWQPGTPIGYRAFYYGNNDENVITKDLTQPMPAGYFIDRGLKPAYDIGRIAPVTGVRLEGNGQPLYWLNTPNFQVITTYNKSRKYATAVWQLGEAVAN